MTFQTERAPWVRVLATVQRPAVKQALWESGLQADWLSEESLCLAAAAQTTLLLDVDTFTPLDLVRTLARLSASHDAAVLALASPDNSGATRLLALCPAVRVIAGNLDSLMSYLSAGVSPSAPALRRVWLRVLAPSVPVADPFVLVLIAALADAPTMESAADRLHMARRTLFRRVHDLRQCLGIEGYEGRLSPLEHANALLEGYYRY
jgi:hypothetical protein